MDGNEREVDRVIGELDAADRRVASAQVELLSRIAQADRLDVWRNDGARDMSHWLGMRYGISAWKARRWIAAAHALPSLPGLTRAFALGRLGMDKVVELARFATPDTEAKLLRWARGVSCGAIRRRGDLLARTSVDEVVAVDRARTLSWWYADDGLRLELHAELPVAQGTVIVKAIERVAATIPEMPDEHGPVFADARRADALAAICSATVAADADQDRGTIVIHAQADLLAEGRGSQLEGGPVVHPETTKRLLCNARVQTVTEDAAGNVVGVGRLSREPSAWMIRQIRHRDQECRFPGCDARRFTQAHHIVWWSRGGRTDLDNLLLICAFHHKLVHEYGWVVKRDGPDGVVRWFRPDGVRYRAGPAGGYDRSLPLAS